MNKQKNKQAGFTLSEMMVVIAIIGVLLVVILPNAIEVLGSAKTQSCSAYLKTVESQVQLYQLNNEGDVPDMGDLMDAKQINSETCPDGSAIVIDADGRVSQSEKDES